MGFNVELAPVKTDLNISNSDEFYAEIVRLHDGLDEAASLKLNAKIILLMANQIGDSAVLAAILAAAAQPGNASDRA